jgi:hypothetical protein
MKNLNEVVSESFIWAVGITRPRPGQERRAAWFITLGLSGTIFAVAAALMLLIRLT